MCIAASLLVHFESASSNANITNFAEALWTLQVTVATIGFGDFYPVTSGGRLVTTVMFYVGFSLIGFIATRFVRSIMGFSETDVRNRELRKQNAEILVRNKKLENKIDSLLTTLEQINHQKRL